MDENKQNGSNNNGVNQSSFSTSSEKRIDVTKPRTGVYKDRRPAIVDDVPEPTEKDREREALERLRNRATGRPSTPRVDSGGSVAKVKKPSSSGEFKKNMKVAIAILLVLIVIAILIVFVIFIGRNGVVENEFSDIRVSIKMENKSSLTMVTETGEEVLRELNPGDTIQLRAYARNSNDYRGDVMSNNSATPTSVYVRFKVVLILGYEERYDLLKPNVGSVWYRYNAEDEADIMGGGVTEDDGYYYYNGSLGFNGRVELFTEIELIGKNFTCDDGGKYGQIQVIVEAVEAVQENLIDGRVWSTAPRHWVLSV